MDYKVKIYSYYNKTLFPLEEKYKFNEIKIFSSETSPADALNQANLYCKTKSEESQDRFHYKVFDIEKI